ncbi:MAG: DUF4162 domain-containing protein, partial [Firmicutes bacterium]|nr:DUF4162 domain-containing protein [Bacillota bacterium]
KKVCEGSPAELKAAYSRDQLLIVPTDATEFERRLNRLNLPFWKTADTYSIQTETAGQSIDILCDLKELIRFYESKKGSMDDVFLNVVGESLKEGAEDGAAR